ncbi:MAG: CheR family methyltransferase [Desulfocapsaceae bacterium]|nr:CheR family methyltransferase [Desulfocapsaceae bacterium]
MTIDLEPFKKLIKQRCGLILEGLGEEKLATVLAQRLTVTKFGNSAEYYFHLQGSSDEFQELVNLLTINETYFFREVEQLHLLTERLVPRLLMQREDNQPLRILSAGCSSGEEPFSLVMALREKYGDDVSSLFSFAGGDIDTQALAKARSGCYNEFSFRGVGPEIKARYFDQDGWVYRLKDEIRNRVEFHEMNLFAEEFPVALHGCDIIFFRNVSIYFDTPTRRIIQQNLASLLKKSGYLVIGTAETIANDFGVLSLIEEDGLFYFSKGQFSAPVPAAAPVFDFSRYVVSKVAAPQQCEIPELPFVRSSPSVTSSLLTSEVVAPVVASFNPCLNIDEVQQYCREKRYEEAMAMIVIQLEQNPGDTSLLLLKAHIQFNRKEFELAEASARQALETDPWSIDAFVLLGLAAKWRDLVKEAIRWFKQAVYARHECWLARYYLADLYRAGGESDKARREYRGVLQLLSQATVPDHGIKVLPLGMVHSELRFLCEHQLGKLGNQRRIARRK